MEFAPVIIPTLNRFEHFKKCIESLNENHNAENTVVYVSVDFPPSDKYVEGHDLICEYLDTAHFRFKKLHVFKQTKNLGVANTGSNNNTVSNGRFLTNLVKKDFDRWILTEDDNIFAPGFLDFMNESLEFFNDDDSVFSICGYRFYYNISYCDNNFFRQNADFNAWGCGFWRKKMERVDKIDVSYLKRLIYNPLRVFKLWKVSNAQVAHICSLSKINGFKKGDNFFTIYMIDNNMVQIMPAKSLVRNIGWDESGLHCNGFEKEVIEKHLCQEIDDSPTFEGLKGTGWEFFKENNRIISKEDFQQSPTFKTVIKYILRIFCFWQ